MPVVVIVEESLSHAGPRVFQRVAEGSCKLALLPEYLTSGSQNMNMPSDFIQIDSNLNTP